MVIFSLPSVGNFTNCVIYLTTIPIEPKILTEFGLLKLKICSLYHENLLLQKLNDMITQVLKYFFSTSDIMEAIMRPFLFLWYEGCVIQDSYCCAVGIGQQAQCNRLAFSVITQEPGVPTSFMDNP